MAAETAAARAKASASPLARLLSPRSIAVVGGREAAEVVRQCERIGFSGAIWPVNPKRAEMGGRPCFPAVAALPAAPDAVFLAAPRESCVGVVADLARMSAGGAVVYASGFAETGEAGARLERELVAASGAMALVGPNCYGFLNYLDGAALWPDQHGGRRVARGVAIVLQSGNIGLNLTMQTRALPIAYLVTVGNKAKGDLADYVDALAGDDRVTAIGLHIEGLEDVAAFAATAERARERGKPIVAIKTGRSTAGAAITLSHTASLAGPDRLYDALFARLGVARARDLATFLETLKLLHVSGPLGGRRLVSMSCSGGEASLIADLAEASGLTTPAFPEATNAALADALGEKVAIGNPLDYHTYIWGDFERSRACFGAALAARFDLTALVLDFPRADRCDGASWEATLAAFEAASRDTGARAAVISSLPETMPEAIAERLAAAGVTPLAGMSEALAAARLAADIGEAWARPAATPLARTAPVAGPAVALDEAEAKRALARFGLPVPALRVASAAEAAAAAAAIGFPVVVKALSVELAHKSDFGGVALDLADEAAVAAAVARMARLADRFLVEPMMRGALAEFIVGVTRDPQFGLALTLGAGGVFVETLGDSATLLLPANRDDIERALDSLRVTRLIEARRGRPAGDRAALVGAIEAVARFAAAHSDRLLEIDVNPLLVFAKRAGVMAVDAFIRLCGGNIP